MSEEKDTEIVPLPGGIDFNQPLPGTAGKPLEEEYFEADDQARANELRELMQLTGAMSRAEAEELMALKKKRPITLGSRCVNVLYGSPEGDKADGTVKLKRHNLARKIGEREDGTYPAVELSKAQKTMIEAQAEKAYSTLVYAGIYFALEGDTKDDDE